jgi:hypothetical protein
VLGLEKEEREKQKAQGKGENLIGAFLFALKTS